MDAAGFSKKQVKIYQTTWRHTSEDSIIVTAVIRESFTRSNEN
jgi:hypothetical protein